MMTFFADIITFYLLFKLITYHFISATNLNFRHAEWVIIMNKDILYVHQMRFIFDAFETDLNFMTKLKTHYVIECYEHDVNVRKLTVMQKNKINTILMIQDFE